MPRMPILITSEQGAFDKPLLFDHRARTKFFRTRQASAGRGKEHAQPQPLARFSGELRVFPGDTRVLCACGLRARDVAYVANQLGESHVSATGYSDHTRQRHQQRILEFHGFAPFGGKAEIA